MRQSSIRSILLVAGGLLVTSAGSADVPSPDPKAADIIRELGLVEADSALRETKGWKAPKSASVIHTDFEKGFIRAEVMAFADYVAHKGEAGCRSAGVFRVEGKEYVVQDGDVMHFRFNV